MLEKALVSLFAFAIFIITYLVVFHFNKIKLYRFRILELLGGIFAIVYTILAFSIPSNFISGGIVEVNTLGQIVSYAIGLFIYLLLFSFFLHPHYTNERVISAKVCTEITNSPGGKLTLEELLKKYDLAGLIGNRLDDMVYGGFLERSGNTYRLTKKGFFTAKVFSFSRKFLHSPLGY